MSNRNDPYVGELDICAYCLEVQADCVEGHLGLRCTGCEEIDDE